MYQERVGSWTIHGMALETTGATTMIPTTSNTVQFENRTGNNESLNPGAVNGERERPNRVASESNHEMAAFDAGTAKRWLASRSAAVAIEITARSAFIRVTSI
jgi:hypothetical protein